MTDPAPGCARCGRPVVKNTGLYETFECMHWVCFHLEFEHDADPDEPCADPSCFWRARGSLSSPRSPEDT